jgi:hypothetical protein
MIEIKAEHGVLSDGQRAVAAAGRQADTLVSPAMPTRRWHASLHGAYRARSVYR